MPFKDPEARREYSRRYRATHRESIRKQRGLNPEHTREVKRRWNSDNSERRRGYRRKYKYGITPEEFQQLCERAQNQCAICGAKEALVVDHAHHTSTIRGLLCRTCNLGIGMLQDSQALLRAALSYLELHNQEQQEPQ